MNEIKKLISYLTSLMAIIGALIGFYVCLPFGDPAVVVTYLGIASATIAAFIKFLRELNGIIDGMEEKK